ncbi:MAG: DUF4398 domain-containing protein [Polyangiales bacterium]
MNTLKSIAFASIVLGLGCAGSPSHSKEIADARSAIRGAEEVGAKNEPKAALHLQLAEEALTAAEDDIREGEDENARMRLERAKVDAELAIALTHEAHMREKAEHVRDRLDSLENESL